jgi:hypothetical protein
MIDSLLNTVLFCSHRRTTFPMTVWRSPYASSAARFGKRTYVICLDCGKEFSYNWEEMRIEAAKPVVDFRIHKKVASWLASVRVLLYNGGIDSNCFLARLDVSTLNVSTQFKSAMMRLRIAIEAMASVCKRLALFRVRATARTRGY